MVQQNFERNKEMIFNIKEIIEEIWSCQKEEEELEDENAVSDFKKQQEKVAEIRIEKIKKDEADKKNVLFHKLQQKGVTEGERKEAHKNYLFQGCLKNNAAPDRAKEASSSWPKPNFTITPKMKGPLVDCPDINEDQNNIWAMEASSSWSSPNFFITPKIEEPLVDYPDTDEEQN